MSWAVVKLTINFDHQAPHQFDQPGTLTCLNILNTPVFLLFVSKKSNEILHLSLVTCFVLAKSMSFPKSAIFMQQKSNRMKQIQQLPTLQASLLRQCLQKQKMPINMAAEN